MKNLVVAMKFMAVVTAVALGIASLGQPAQAQDSHWTIDLIVRPLGDKPSPTLYDSISAQSIAFTADEEVIQHVPVLDRSNLPSELRVGVYARIRTDGANPRENLDAVTTYPAGYASGDLLLGLQAMAVGLYFSGTGGGGQAAVNTYTAAADLVFHNAIFTTGIQTLFGFNPATASLASSTTLNGTSHLKAAGATHGKATATMGGTSFRLAYPGALANEGTPIKGSWCKVETGSDSCEIFFGVLNLPTAGLPDNLDTFTVKWGTLDQGPDGDISAQVAPWHNRATSTARRGDPLTYTFCSGNDCQPTVQFGASTYTVSEGDGSNGNTVEVGVALGSIMATTSPVVVDIAVGAPDSGTAAVEGTHFTLSSKQVTIPAGSTNVSMPITVTTMPDDTPSGIDDLAFKLTMTVSSPATGVTLGIAETTVSIVEDDLQDVITLSIDNDTVAEDGSAVTVTVTATLERNLGVQEDISIGWEIGGTATNGTDYGMVTATSGALDIGANMTTSTTTVTITPTQDTTVEGEETITFTPTSGSYSGTNTTFVLEGATFTLTDDDTTTVTIARKASDPAPDEGGMATFTAAFGEAVANAVSITWAANDDVDGTSATIAAGTIVAGSLTQEFTVTIEDDDLAEGMESVSLTFDVPGGFITGGTVTGAAQSIDVNASDPITIAVDGPDTHREGAMEDYTVTLSGGTPSADVMITVTAGGFVAGSGGTAPDAGDVTLPSAPLTITAPGLTGTVTITMVDDGYQAGEVGNQMTLTFAGSGSGGAGFTSGTKLVTISQLPSVEVTAGAATIAEDGGAVEFTVSVSNPVADAMDLDWSITHTDTEAADFSGATSGTISFAANDTDDKTFSVTVADDNLAEMAESFSAMLAFASGSASLDAVSVVIGTPTADVEITDNEAVALVLSQTGSAREGGSAEYTVAVEGGVVLTADLTYSIAVAHGTSSAADLGTPPTSGTIASGSSSGTFEIEIVKEDTGTMADEDAGETFTVTISSASGGGGASPTITTASVESEITEVPTISVLPLDTHMDQDDNVVDEDEGQITFYLQMDEDVGLTSSATASWEVRGIGSSDPSEDATGSGSVTFSASDEGEAGRKTITVRIVDDNIAEPDTDGFEVVVTEVLVGGSVEEEILVAGDSAEVTIMDNDDLVVVFGGRAVPGTEDPGAASGTAHDSMVAQISEGSESTFTVEFKNGVVATEDVDITVALTYPGSTRTSATPLGLSPTMDDDFDFDAVATGADAETDTFDGGTFAMNKSATVTITAGESSATVNVFMVREEEPDMEDPGTDPPSDKEQFQLTLSAPAFATAVAGVTVELGTDVEKLLTVTVGETDPEALAMAAQETLVAFGSALTSHVVSLIEDRIAADIGNSATIGGTNLSFGSLAGDGDSNLTSGEQNATAFAENVKGVVERFTEDDGYGGRVLTSVKAKELIPGSAFNLNLTGKGGMMDGSWGAWGKVSLLNFAREPEEGEVSSIDGKSTAASLGIEYKPNGGNMKAGAAIIHTQSDSDFNLSESPGTGNVESTLTMLQPYAAWELENDTTAWVSAGYGTGELEMKHVTLAGGAKTDIDAQLLAAGLRQGLMSGGGFDWAVKGDGRFSKINVDAVENKINATSATSHTLRAAVEGTTTLSMDEGGSLKGSVEVGARWDGGDGDNGLGAEIGGGLIFSDPSSGFSLDGRVRMVVAHQADGFKEWGASLTAAVAPGGGDRGLKFSMTPSVGQAGSGVDSLLGTAQAAATEEEDEEEFSPQVRLNSEIGYGMGVWDDIGTFTPTGALSLSDNSHKVKLGGKLSLLTRRDIGVNLDLYNERELKDESAANRSSLVLDSSVEQKFGTLGSVELFNKMSDDDDGSDYELGLRTKINF